METRFAAYGLKDFRPELQSQPFPALEKLRVLPAVVFGNPLGTALRVLNWADAWAHRDPNWFMSRPGGHPRTGWHAQAPQSHLL
jgi:hypothetical protein